MSEIIRVLLLGKNKSFCSDLKEKLENLQKIKKYNIEFDLECSQEHELITEECFDIYIIDYPIYKIMQDTETLYTLKQMYPLSKIFVASSIATEDILHALMNLNIDGCIDTSSNSVEPITASAFSIISFRKQIKKLDKKLNKLNSCLYRAI